MVGSEVRERLETLLPAEEIKRLCRELGVVERERKLDVSMLVRMMMLSAGTPSGARQADVLRSQSIAMTFELDGNAAELAWERIARVLTHTGKDPNGKRKPSVLDQLRGWQPASKRKKPGTRSHE
ncbi:MAG: hypothetical protein EA398_16020 [Deltaproteobacteria bacterium]|nr:MAG: hypothetical protein EA398_16020 [Deltaproteobacteria bacterium]